MLPSRSRQVLRDTLATSVAFPTEMAVLSDGLVGATTDLDGVQVAFAATCMGVEVHRGDLVFDPTGQELGECLGFFQHDGELMVYVRAFALLAKISETAGQWQTTETVEQWPMLALELAFGWYACGSEGKLMVLRM